MIDPELIPEDLLPAEPTDEILIRYVPTRHPSATKIPLNTTSELLPPDLLKQRDEALSRIATRGAILPLTDGIT